MQVNADDELGVYCRATGTAIRVSGKYMQCGTRAHALYRDCVCKQIHGGTHALPEI